MEKGGNELSSFVNADRPLNFITFVGTVWWAQIEFSRKCFLFSFPRWLCVIPTSDDDDDKAIIESENNAVQGKKERHCSISTYFEIIPFYMPWRHVSPSSNFPLQFQIPPAPNKQREDGEKLFRVWHFNFVTLAALSESALNVQFRKTQNKKRKNRSQKFFPRFYCFGASRNKWWRRRRRQTTRICLPGNFPLLLNNYNKVNNAVTEESLQKINCLLNPQKKILTVKIKASSWNIPT